MITFYGAPTPNGRKIPIALEEIGCAYHTHTVDLGKEEQLQDWFLALNPNHKIPVIKDEETGAVVWESGAILQYLGETYDNGGIILPKDKLKRIEAMQFAFFQASYIGPTLGRLGSQVMAPEEERNQGMLEIFSNEFTRLIGVLDRVLSDGRQFIAGPYSIADIMHYPWLKLPLDMNFPALVEKPRVTGWLNRIGERPAVQKGMAAL